LRKDKGFHLPLFGRFVYASSRQLFRLIGAVFFRYRVLGRENWPSSGGALVCANHQSFLDPIIIGCTCDRRLHYMARKNLFDKPFFRWLIGLYNAFPVEREGMGIGGLKETLRRMKYGEMVVIFPEGTRTLDGFVGELHPGFCAVARRAKQPIVPLGMDGAFGAWPRGQKRPKLHPISVTIGEPISVEQVAEMTDEALLAEVQKRIVACHASSRASIQGK
jgi:1-acyl-sn-glycerol-3-phosphate acyltransferase